MAQHFDVVVLGAGPGGYVAAIRASQLGLKTAIIEKQYWGGICLNVGCIPSKALLRNAEIAHILTKEAKTFGISGDVSMDYGVAFTRSRGVADASAKGVHYLMKKNSVTEFEGTGTFTDPHTIEVALNAGGSETVTADNVIIDTGTTTRLIPGTELSERVVTFEEQILTDNLPESIVIAGSGAIGVEFAYVMSQYGVDVTIVEFLDRMVPTEDADVSKELLRQYKKLGIKVLLSTKVESIDDSGDKVKVTVSPAAGGDSQVIETDKVLQAIGFAPRTQGYGLEKTGVELNDKGAIAVDARGRTNVDGVYAIGDVTGKLMLAHTAEAMAIVAAETIADVETVEIDFDMIPRATFCQPQIASFGYTEQQAKDLGYDVKTASFPYSANGKSRGMAETVGFVKVVADAKHNELLGAHMIGPEVTELLPALTLAQKWDLTADEVSRNIFAHPTLSEAVKEAVEGIAGHMINL
ncbi:dihydrolipoyl dehydrogenase [Flexivirga sp. ID2601S]|uniref:Dihydrolipoyl dehydrogenase n=1 Tax=Flexivirga aerilata TaxID=1656889 RepID=A0A849AKR2_9MICO|nr:dihydrolipoyl dehydrogenase [Flexivirga aerilata]